MNSEWGEAVLMAVIGLPCGVVAVTAGGGVTLGVPLLMLAGLPGANSVIAIKVALWASFLAGAATHATRRPVLAVPLPVWVWPLCLVGASAGAGLLTSLDPDRLRGLLLPLLVASIAGTFLASRRRTHDAAPPTATRRAAGYVALVALAVYSGFFGAGFGVFLIWALVALHGHSPASAAALGTRLSLAISSMSVAVLVWQGAVIWSTALPLAAGCAVGGVLGARATRLLGDRFITATTWAVSILVAVKLWVSG